MHSEHSSTIVQKTMHLTTSDGLPLFVRHTCAAGAIPERTLVVVHGAGEHSQRYEHWARLLAQHNWRVVSLDHRGYGLSGGPPGHIDRFDQYLIDMDRVWQALALCPEQTIVFGHSLGGLISVRYAQTRPNSMRALVLSCPLLALQLNVPAWKRTLGRICSLLAPRTRFRTSIRTDQLTSDPAARRTRENDPLRCRFVTASWYFQVLDAMVAAWDEAPQMALPTLLLQGDQDEVVNPEAATKWWLRLTGRDKTLRVLGGHLHELLSEPDWEQTAAVIVEWMEARLPDPHDTSLVGWLHRPSLPVAEQSITSRSHTQAQIA
ncbi:MAG: lysophospholipase [Planctomycetota bacterium]|nr:MAG: lysophospholipase [Planctomycetota bacterium]